MPGLNSLPGDTMTIETAMRIIGDHTGGADTWDSEALREIAERVVAGLPVASHAAGSGINPVTGLKKALDEIRRLTT